MENLQYLDIHTHRRENNSQAVSVASLSPEEILAETIPKEFASAGVHPWWLEDYTSDKIKKFQTHIENLAKMGKLWAIGETGIDRAYPEFLDQQKELFNFHMKLSEDFGLPLIIHSVRAGSDFLQILKDHKPQMPWIFHDFRGNETLVKDLLRLHPETYFSFGISIDNSKEIRELIPLIPIGQFFLETDEQKHLDIHDIYLRAAHHLSLDLDFLKSQVWHNFKKVSKRPVS